MLILKITNVSNLAEISDYVWTAFVNDKKIASGEVKGHRRALGWKALVEKVISEKFGCYCDLEPGQKPDDCVLDTSSASDCVYAELLVKNGKSKEQCEYWKPITRKRVRK